MLDIVAVVAPVFGLIGLGFLAARLGLLTQRAGEGLAEYVFTLAIPFLLLRTILAAHFPPSLPWAYWTAYFAAVALCWAIATALARGPFWRLAAGGCIERSRSISRCTAAGPGGSRAACRAGRGGTTGRTSSVSPRQRTMPKRSRRCNVRRIAD